jgi:hypothetical protein
MINYLLNFFLCGLSCLCIVYFRFNNPIDNKLNIGKDENNGEKFEPITNNV